MDVVEFLRNPEKFTRLGGKLPKVMGVICGDVTVWFMSADA